MSLNKHYDPGKVEPKIQAFWEENGIYRFSRESDKPVYSIDTPPPTVSGNLHLGHVYSYSHTDFFARYRRMQGDNVFYPMGYDDNGLPTDRLVEKRFNIRAKDVGRSEFVEKCMKVSEQAEGEYQELWKRIGLSIDWRYTYRTIDKRSKRIAQYSFLDLYKKGKIYQRDAPTIWCPECQTAIAQAELNDLDRDSEFITLAFKLEHGEILPIATTRPELLPACVAIFIHPSDQRYQNIVGASAVVPLFDQVVPILSDPAVDPQIGTGAVMCCTFGDITDVSWWYSYGLPLIEVISPDGKLTQGAGEFAGLPMDLARKQIVSKLHNEQYVIERKPTAQSIRVHERCDTPAEYIVNPQWFVRILDQKEIMLQAGEIVSWFPSHMKARYRDWVENLKWDWCISRQRYFGVHFPLWYCNDCGEVILADVTQLPVDPHIDSPHENCPQCGSDEFIPEGDVFDTWMTSSMTPQIVGGWQDDQSLYKMVYPFSLRPQAHEIIRTWAFYTIYKSINHFDRIPWDHVAISGWGIAGEGMGKVSKSRGGGPMPPSKMINKYSADAVRYWSASTSLGKDSIISEEKIQIGYRLVNKIWNVARFTERFLIDYIPPVDCLQLSPADQWILSKLQRLIERVTDLFENYEYASSKSEIETFFWTELADNYLEMCKQRLYEKNNPGYEGARFTLYNVLLTLLKLLAPIMPFVTEEIYQCLFSHVESEQSIHNSGWPLVNKGMENIQAEQFGTILVEIATFVRKFKSEQNLSLGTKINRLIIVTEDEHTAENLKLAKADLISITRAIDIEVMQQRYGDIPFTLLTCGISINISL